MDRVKEIEAAIHDLPPDQYWRLAEWFREFEQKRWDSQMDEISASGRFLFEEAETESANNLKKGTPIMARIDTSSEIDWTQCELIEQVPGKVSGRPIVRGTRILPDAIVNSYDAGEPLDLIHENYPGLSIPQIQRLIEFAHVRRGQPVR